MPFRIRPVVPVFLNSQQLMPTHHDIALGESNHGIRLIPERECSKCASAFKLNSLTLETTKAHEVRERNLRTQLRGQSKWLSRPAFSC